MLGIRDRMDTGIINVDTVLELSGDTKLEDIDAFPHRPSYFVQGIGGPAR